MTPNALSRNINSVALHNSSLLAVYCITSSYTRIILIEFYADSKKNSTLKAFHFEQGAYITFAKQPTVS